MIKKLPIQATLDPKVLALTIQEDLDRGIFDSWPKLKSRLQFIGEKLIKAAYCSHIMLSAGEEKTLRENDYI